MTILCPHCRKPHSLPPGGLPGRKSAARCKGCGLRFILAQGTDGLNILPEHTTAPETSVEFEHDSNGKITEGAEPLDSISPSEEWPGTAPAQEEKDVMSEQPSPTKDIVQAFPQLLPLTAKHYLLESLFTPNSSGNYRTRPNRLKAKLLLACSSLLESNVLQPEELVCKIARGSAYFPFEIPYANGLFTLPDNYYALVCTTHRLLLINLDFRCTRSQRYTFQVLYDEISKISRGLFGTSLIIKIRNGGKWNFTTVKHALARDLARYLTERINVSPSGYYDGIPRRQLCPSCLTPLTGGLTSCPACQTTFKTAREALKRSLLLPGMGEIYLGNFFPGLAVLTGYLLAWLIAVALTIVNLAGGIWGGGLLIVAYHLGAGFMARRMGHKGYLSEKITGRGKENQVIKDPGISRNEPESSGGATVKESEAKTTFDT